MTASSSSGTAPLVIEYPRLDGLAHTPHSSKGSVALIRLMRLIPCHCTMSLMLLHKLHLLIGVELQKEFAIFADAIVPGVFAIEILDHPGDTSLGQ
jgi:hypothetical protein